MQWDPLAQYMRQASIYIKLPSKNNIMTGAIQIPDNRIPVLPMDTRDE